VKARLLFVEDSPSQGSQTKLDLEQLGYEVRWVKSGIEALKWARQDPPDLIVLDVVMEDLDGFAVCRWLKLHTATRDIPIIMLTVRAEIDDKVHGLQVGADDYLPKPFSKRELEARIFAALRNKTTQTELVERNRQLESMLHHVESLAITDPLTGIFNRRRFADVLRREVAVTRRYKNCLSLLMIDLDHFKTVNDRFGHDAGDEVLRAVAAALTSGLREVDLAARYGGEEFAIVMPQTSKANALIVAQRIAGQIAFLEHSFQGETIMLTASMGIADIADLKVVDAENLVKAADIALYEAKRAGRNKIVLFDESLLNEHF
jgi:two-component system, cell cycle response regulator